MEPVAEATVEPQPLQQQSATDPPPQKRQRDYGEELKGLPLSGDEESPVPNKRQKRSRSVQDDRGNTDSEGVDDGEIVESPLPSQISQPPDQSHMPLSLSALVSHPTLDKPSETRPAISADQVGVAQGVQSVAGPNLSQRKLTDYFTRGRAAESSQEGTRVGAGQEIGNARSQHLLALLKEGGEGVGDNMTVTKASQGDNLRAITFNARGTTWNVPPTLQHISVPTDQSQHDAYFTQLAAHFLSHFAQANHDNKWLLNKKTARLGWEVYFNKDNGFLQHSQLGPVKSWRAAKLWFTRSPVAGEMTMKASHGKPLLPSGPEKAPQVDVPANAMLRTKGVPKTKTAPQTTDVPKPNGVRELNGVPQSNGASQSNGVSHLKGSPQSQDGQRNVVTADHEVITIPSSSDDEEEEKEKEEEEEDSQPEPVRSVDPEELRLQRRYFPGAEDPSRMCLSCSSDEHLARDCPELRCSTCNSDKHNRFGCPANRRCGKCFQTGHTMSMCQEKIALAPEERGGCLFCGAMHPEEACRLPWTSFRPTKRNIRKVQFIPCSCYKCGREGHYGPECALPDRKGTWPDPMWSQAGRNLYTDPTSPNVALDLIGLDPTKLQDKVDVPFHVPGGAKRTVHTIYASSDDSEEDLIINGHPRPRRNNRKEIKISSNIGAMSGLNGNPQPGSGTSGRDWKPPLPAGPPPPILPSGSIYQPPPPGTLPPKPQAFHNGGSGRGGRGGGGARGARGGAAGRGRGRGRGRGQGK